MKKPALLFIFISMVAMISNAQTLGRFDVQLTGKNIGIDIPFTVDIIPLDIKKGTDVEVRIGLSGKRTVVVPAQLHNDNSLLSLVIPGNLIKNEDHLHFEIRKRTAATAPLVKLLNKDGALTIESGGKNLLRYWHKTVMPPPGTDSNYKRSGFIHPLWTPNGQELTRIHPPDHYHHFGIWNPWTHTLFENDTVDFWNIKGRKGTVRFEKFTEIVSGPVYAQYDAVHNHVVFKKDGTEKSALTEVQSVRVHKPSENADHYIVDFRSEMNCASNSPLLILAYRYGGLGWRATELWNKDNSEILTSEGKTRKNTDGSKAKWCIAQGELGTDYGGIVMMSHPGNYNHPEPLRIWDEKANGGRGDMFVNFAPTKDKDWLLQPKRTYVLQYRFLVFNGKFDAAKAEAAWQAFAAPLTTVSK
jgi:hypothetical protein